MQAGGGVEDHRVAANFAPGVKMLYLGFGIHRGSEIAEFGARQCGRHDDLADRWCTDRRNLKCASLLHANVVGVKSVGGPDVLSQADEGDLDGIDRRAAADRGFGESLQRAHERYAAERDALVSADADRRPRGGVAGSEGGVKCLHAHFADHAAGNENPVGAVTAPWVEPLDCEMPCVVDGENGPMKNPRWVEPK